MTRRRSLSTTAGCERRGRRAFAPGRVFEFRKQKKTFFYLSSKSSWWRADRFLVDDRRQNIHRVFITFNRVNSRTNTIAIESYVAIARRLGKGIIQNCFRKYLFPKLPFRRSTWRLARSRAGEIRWPDPPLSGFAPSTQGPTALRTGTIPIP